MLARRWSRDERFAFGTWKIEVLGAFASALLLGVVALAMVCESVHAPHARPSRSSFVPALVVAVIGLVGEPRLGAGAGAWRTSRTSSTITATITTTITTSHEHDHGHGHGHEKHHDLNLQSAYVHVVADAFTSVLAIVALSAGLWVGWSWLDPGMGIVGAGVILWWAKGLLADSARVLARPRDGCAGGRRRSASAIQSDGDAEIADLHVWRVGRASLRRGRHGGRATIR